MEIYNYNPETGEYINISTADENPLEKGEYLIPANATTIEPPTARTNQVAVFEKNTWSLKTDHRGEIFYKKSDLSEVVITEIGNISNDYLTSLPDKPLNLPELYLWDGSTYVFSMDLLRNKRNQLLTNTDKYMLSDYPITDERKNEWKTYRQALRDLPKTIDINNPAFPTQPD
jgi:hypothetical protein